MSQELVKPKPQLDRLSLVEEEQIELPKPKLKASQILRQIAKEKRYKWTTGAIDLYHDGKDRCALGAILGYFGWEGYNGESQFTSPDPYITYQKEMNSVGLYRINQWLGIAAYNNNGHDYEACADWLEEKGF